jgi:hypothetical protein
MKTEPLGVCYSLCNAVFFHSWDTDCIAIKWILRRILVVDVRKNMCGCLFHIRNSCLCDTYHIITCDTYHIITCLKVIMTQKIKEILVSSAPK